MSIYMDLLTNAKGRVKAWYTGSTTGFGSPISATRHQLYAPGLTGRLLSYFSVLTPKMTANCRNLYSWDIQLGMEWIAEPWRSS